MWKKIREIDTVYFIVPITIFFALWCIWAFTGLWPWSGNPYNSYSLQACSWLEGRLDLGQNYEWLELAIFEGKYYVSFPPFPSYVLLPFAIFFGAETPDHWIVLAVTLIGSLYAIRLYKKVVGNTKYAPFFVLFLYLGTGLNFVVATGYVWFIAQAFCFTLSLMSLTYAVEGKGGLSLICWACAVGCRPMVVLYFPLLVIILWKKWKETNKKKTILDFLRAKWNWGIGVTVIALSYMILNYARFGSIMEFGHNYLPEFMREKKGQFHLDYLLPNIGRLFRLPGKEGINGALQFYNSDGMAFWLVTPIFITIAIAWIYAIVKKRKQQKGMLILLPILFLAHVIFICSHRTLGGWHWGNRYLLDCLPYLFLGLLWWMPEGEKRDNFVSYNSPLFYFGMIFSFIGSVAVYNYWI